MPLESLQVSVCVASLGSRMELLSKTSPSLVLETLVTACLLSNRGPFVFYVFPGVLSLVYQSSQLEANGGVFFLFHLWKIQESILKITHFLITSGHALLSPYIAFQIEDFLKKVNVEPYQRHLQIKNGLFKIPKIQQ